MNFGAFRFMCDEDLRERIGRLERKVIELKEANTSIAAALCEQFEQALQAAQEELSRRHV